MPLDPLFDRESFVADHFQVTLLARALPDMTHLTELVVPYIATNRSLLNNMILFYILHDIFAGSFISHGSIKWGQALDNIGRHWKISNIQEVFFRLVAGVGRHCPRLRLLDLSGTEEVAQRFYLSQIKNQTYD